MRHYDDSTLVVKLLDLRADLMELIRETVAYDRTACQVNCPCRDHSLELLKKKLRDSARDLL